MPGRFFCQIFIIYPKFRLKGPEKGRQKYKKTISQHPLHAFYLFCPLCLSQTRFSRFPASPHPKPRIAAGLVPIPSIYPTAMGKSFPPENETQDRTTIRSGKAAQNKPDRNTFHRYLIPIRPFSGTKPNRFIPRNQSVRPLENRYSDKTNTDITL